MELFITPAVMPANKFIGTATIISPVEAEKKSTNMVVGSMDVEAEQAVVIKITNETEYDIYRFAMGEKYATHVQCDFTALLYTADGTKIDAVYQTEGGDMFQFEFSDNTSYKVAPGETVYLVFIPAEAVEGFNVSVY